VRSIENALAAVIDFGIPLKSWRGV